ncbi:MAG: hypothetical protein NTW21_08110 [Verrucomicrobia bacterium]|nr:hypothetical protein [Verrucomicrobiota bacterium]
MSQPTPPPSADSAATPARLGSLHRLDTPVIRPAARDYYVRWTEEWAKARGNRCADATTAFLDALGRSTHLAAWQFNGIVFFDRHVLRIPTKRNRLRRCKDIDYMLVTRREDNEALW